MRIFVICIIRNNLHTLGQSLQSMEKYEIPEFLSPIRSYNSSALDTRVFHKMANRVKIR